MTLALIAFAIGYLAARLTQRKPVYSLYPKTHRRTEEDEGE